MLALAKHACKLLTINVFSLSTLEDASSVEVKCMESENADKPYLTGKFVIASLERTDAVQDDATYSISLENDSEVTFDETAYRGEWERVRRLAAISIQPHVKKTVTPQKNYFSSPGTMPARNGRIADPGLLRKRGVNGSRRLSDASGTNLKEPKVSHPHRHHLFRILC